MHQTQDFFLHYDIVFACSFIFNPVNLVFQLLCLHFPVLLTFGLFFQSCILQPENLFLHSSATFSMFDISRSFISSPVFSFNPNISLVIVSQNTSKQVTLTSMYTANLPPTLLLVYKASN